MSAVSPVSPANPLTTWARYALIAVAWLFTLGGLVQVFLAGLSVFDARDWSDHVDMGWTISFLAYLLPVLAVVGRAGVRLVGQALVVAILMVVQIVLANLDNGTIAALHPLNGFLLIGAAGSLGGAA